METTIKPTSAEILERYKSGNNEQRDALEFVLGANFFNQTVFEDLDELEQRVLMAYHRLRKKAKEKRGDWTPDWSDSRQPKYTPFPRFNGSGFVVGATDFDWTGTHTRTNVGSRLCFPTSSMALEFFNENKEDYNLIFLN